ncbi:MAG: hypothetical protein ACJAZ9_001831 [Neolewinella sp.]|jgi:hypothetical protein
MGPMLEVLCAKEVTFNVQRLNHKAVKTSFLKAI